MKSISVSSVAYQIDGLPYEGRLAFDPSREDPLPGLLMAPNWMGISEGAEEIAKSVAEQGYVVLIADLYGQATRPANGDEAGAAMMPLKNDRALLRKRMWAAYDVLKTRAWQWSTAASWRPLASVSVVAARWNWRAVVRR